MNGCDMEKSAEAYFRSMADDLDPYPGNLKKHEVKQTTNDPAGEYKREPLLSVIKAPASQDHWVIDGMALVGYNWYASESNDKRHAEHLAEFINKCIEAVIHAKITKGELMVVKTAHNLNKGHNFLCSECDKHVDDPAHGTDFNFCPGCGAKIIE